MRSRFLPALAALAVLAVVAAGCGGAGPGSLPAGAVAVVGGATISRQELDATVDRALSRLKAQGQKPPSAGSDEYRALQQQALQYLVQREELALEAERLGVTVREKEVERRLRQVKRQYFGGSEARYRRALQAQGVTEEDVRQELRGQLLSEALYEKVSADVKVTDADVEAYYRAHPQEYSQPATREVRHILVKTRREAEEVLARLKAGAGFAALARRYSTDPGTKSLGGKLTVQKGQTVPPFDRVAFSLKTGALSRPVRTEYGWHVIQALGPVKPARVTPLAQVRARIRQLLLQQRKGEAVNAWLKEVRERYADEIAYAPGFAPPETAPTATAPGPQR